jgi:hypothetical protein
MLAYIFKGVRILLHNVSYGAVQLVTSKHSKTLFACNIFYHYFFTVSPLLWQIHVISLYSSFVPDLCYKNVVTSNRGGKSVHNAHNRKLSNKFESDAEGGSPYELLRKIATLTLLGSARCPLEISRTIQYHILLVHYRRNTTESLQYPC